MAFLPLWLVRRGSHNSLMVEPRSHHPVSKTFYLPMSSDNPPEAPAPPGSETQEGGILAAVSVLPPILAIAGILLHPTQLTVRQWADLFARTLGSGEALAQMVPAVNVTPSDLFFLAGFLLWVPVRWGTGRLARRLRGYPAALGGLLLAGLISMVPLLKSWPSWAQPPSMVPADSVKQLLQLFLFFVCGFVLIADYLSVPRWRKKLVTAFVVAVAAALVVGLWEYMQLRPASPESRQAGAIVSALHVDATFGMAGEAAGAHEQIGTRSNRNVLGAWLTLVLPLLWAGVLWGRDWNLRIGAAVLTGVGAVLLLHGGLWAAAVVALLALAYARGQIAFWVTAAGLFALFGALFWLAPQQPDQVLLDSLMLRRTSDRFRTLPVYSIDPQLDESGRPANLQQDSYIPWEQKYIQWQPSLLALARNPLSGVGLGNYQKNINRFYSDTDFGAYGMPKAPDNLMEKGGNAFYAVWLTETGLVGGFAMVWLLLSFLFRGMRGASAARAVGDELAFRLKAGACAAIGAAAFGFFFTNYWVRGLGYAFVFVLALVAAAPFAGEQTEEEGDEPRKRA